MISLKLRERSENGFFVLRYDRLRYFTELNMAFTFVMINFAEFILS